MKSNENKKLIILILSVGFIRFLFVFIMILTASIAFNLGSHEVKPILNEKPSVAKVISFHPISKIDYQKIKLFLDEKPSVAKVISFHPISKIDYQKIKLFLDEKPSVAKVINFHPISNIDSQKIKLVLDEKPVIVKVMSSQHKEEDFTAAEKKYRLTPVADNDTERLFHPIIIKMAIRHQIDPALVKAIIMAESGYNSRAISKNGAIGLMQLMPETAKELNVGDIFNPKQNIDGGIRYFKQLLNQFSGDLKLALAAYNAGSNTVRKYKGIPPFKETQNYIEKVFEYYQLYKNQIKEEVDNA